MYELKWNTIYQIIMKESIILIHKSVYENKPKAVTQFYTYSLNSNNNIRSTLMNVYQYFMCNIDLFVILLHVK